MDITTLAGIILGLLAIGGSIVVSGGAAMFVHIPSLLIVLGGTLAATAVNFPMSEVIRVMKVAKNAFTFRIEGQNLYP